MSGLRIGIDLGGAKIEAVLMNAAGEAVHRERRPAPQGDYEATLRALCGVVDDLDARAGAPCPVGIGTPGAWVASRHVLKNCNATWLNGRPLLDDLVLRLGSRARIANDANCFALSEARDGAGRRAKVVFGVIVGTGVGGGLSNIEWIYERVPELMPDYGFSHEGATLLKPARFGDASGVLGAARLHD